MSNKVDRTGHRYGRLVVIREVEKEKPGVLKWLCRCDCGNEVKVRGMNLTSGNTTSCGCYNIEKIKEAHTVHGHNTKSGATSEYVAWNNVRSRCHEVNSTSFKDYGARGIQMCQRWKDSFVNFLSDMGLKPTAAHSIERRDTNGDYEPSNCYWGTDEQQRRNKRNNHWIEYEGRKMIISDWAVEFGAFEENLRRMMKTKTFAQCAYYYRNNKRKSLKK